MNTTVEEPFLNIIEKSSTIEVDPLELDTEPSSVNSNQDTTNTASTINTISSNVLLNATQSQDTNIEITLTETTTSTENKAKDQDLTGKDLLRCFICKEGYETAQSFRLHIVKCMVESDSFGIARPFKCFHCIKFFKSINSLIEHMRLHGTVRYSCSLCDYKHQHQLPVRSHMKTKHNVNSVVVTPVDPKKNNTDEDDFVVRPKIKRQKSLDGSGGHKDSIGDNLDDSVNYFKLSYGPDEVDALPIRPIFSQELKCAVCGYITKVSL